MAVADLVRLFESIDEQVGQSRSSTPNMKLSLQTMFHPSRPRTRRSPHSSPSSSSQSSPQTPYRSLSRAPHTVSPSSDIYSLFSPASSASSSPSSTLTQRMRRQPSAIDIALEEERLAEGFHHTGLGLFEPRPRACTPSPNEVSYSLMEFKTETQPVPAVLDGIFEVMESN